MIILPLLLALLYITTISADGGVITGAAVAAGGTIIGSIISSTKPFSSGPRSEGKAGGCHWSGNAPFCSGACDANNGLEEVFRYGNMKNVENGKKFGRDFGGICWTGTKSLCCKGTDDFDRKFWEGVWESTDGTVWRCKIKQDSASICNGRLVCSAVGLGTEEASWFIGHGGNCHSLKSDPSVDPTATMTKCQEKTKYIDDLEGKINKVKECIEDNSAQMVKEAISALNGEAWPGKIIWDSIENEKWIGYHAEKENFQPQQFWYKV